MIELIPKKLSRPPFGRLFFMIVSVLLFVGIVVGFYIITQMQSDSNEILASLRARLERISTPQERELEAELLVAKDRIGDFTIIVEERTDFLAVFQLLERTTHPGIQLIKFDANVEKEEIVIAGEATDFRILEQQRLVWRDRNEILDLFLTDVELSLEGGVNFDASLRFPFNFVFPYATEIE